MSSQQVRARRPRLILKTGIQRRIGNLSVRVPKAHGIQELIAFGQQADRHEYPYIDAGGFIVLGDQLYPISLPRKEEKHEHVRTTGPGQQRWKGSREKAGSAAGPRQRPRIKTTTARTPAHAVGLVAGLDVLAELRDYGDSVSVIRSSAQYCYVQLNVGLFRDLPHRATLELEIPLLTRRELPSVMPTSVPDARGWAWWSDGPFKGTFIESHHQNPDLSICACMPQDWTFGRDALITYVDFCIVWIGKALHERLLGRYPGKQHYGERERVRRDRQNEYCGCGRSVLYRDCCRAADLALFPADRSRRWREAQQQYIDALAKQSRSIGFPLIS
jgi:hypothetical protein